MQSTRDGDRGPTPHTVELIRRAAACWRDVGGDHHAPLFVYVRAAPRIGLQVKDDTIRLICTTGLIELLSRRELRAAMAHERVHLDRGHHQGLASLPWVLLRTTVPIRVIASTVARHGEFVADRGAARLTGDPLALASALLKIRRADRSAPPGMLAFVAGSAHPRTAKRVRRLERLARRSPAGLGEGEGRSLQG